MEQKKDTASLEAKQFVVFHLDNEEYATLATDLQEIIDIPEITTMPNTPEFIRGILNLRGDIIVVLDLEKRFKLVRENKIDQKHILVAEVDENPFGVLVDNVSGIIRVTPDQIKASPSLLSSKIDAKYISGVIVLQEDAEIEKAPPKDSRLIILLDIKNILQTDELMEINKVITSNKPKEEKVNKDQ